MRLLSSMKDPESRQRSNWPVQLVGEVRSALRGLRKGPWFSLGIVVTVATALAANATLAAFLSGYFWKPLPIEGAARHVEVSGRNADGRVNSAWSSTEALHLKEGAARLLDPVYTAAERRASVVPPGAADPVPALGAVVSREYFAIVRPRLALGRLPSDNLGGDPGTPGVVLSDAGWRRLAGGEMDILGQALRIDGAFFRVTGVLVPGFTGLEPVTPDFWVLRESYASAVGPLRQGCVVGGILRPGVTAAAASDAMTVVMRSLPPAEREAPPTTALVLPRTSLIRERAELAPLVLTLLAAFALMTLVACANLSGIYHARVAGHAADFSIRFALGASRGRIVRQVLLEGLALASVGGVLACLASWLAVDRLQGHVFSVAVSAGLTLAPVTVDAIVFLYTMLLAVAVGLACTLTPALAALSAQPGTPSRGRATALGGPRPHRALQRLVAVQAGISVMLLLAAGIVVKNAVRAGRVEVGYDVSQLADLSFERLLPDRVEQFLLDPRVEAATTVAHTPLSGQLPRIAARAGSHAHRLRYNVVDHRFLETLRIPVLRGRGFERDDGAGEVPRVILGASAARLLWPGGDAVGRQVDIDTSHDATPRWQRHEVIGVVGDALGGFFFEGRETPTLYLPAPVASAGTQELVVRARGNVATSANLRALCRAYDPDALCRPMPLGALLARQQVPFTVAAEIAASLGGVTLVLACIGLYGLVSFSVVRQTRDIGIRMALGATRTRILGGIVSRAGASLMRGAAFGLPAAFMLLALLEWQVPMLDTGDPAVFVAVPVLLLVAGLATAVVPARRAARVDPIVALRE